MSDFILQFERRYSMAHRLLSGAAPRCSVPHGHNEVVKVDITASEQRSLDSSTNMLAEFSVVKKRWFHWIDKHVDHSFQIADTDPLIDYFREHEPERLPRLLITPGDPTTEIRAACYMAKLNVFLVGQGLVCNRLTIDETPTNSVVFAGNPSQVLPAGDHWWWQDDESINDFSRPVSEAKKSVPSHQRRDTVHST